MSWKIYLTLLSVLNTYSLPTISLLKYIQSSDQFKCPNLRTKLISCYGKLDYLTPCVNPFDTNSSNTHDIRCNLYISQLNLLCDSGASAEDYEVCMTQKDFEREFDLNKGLNMLDATCAAFARPLNVGNIDEFIVKKCPWICTDVKTDQIETLCVAAAYFRMIVLNNERHKATVNVTAQQPAYNPDKTNLPTIAKELQPISQQSANKSLDITNNIDQSGNDGLSVVSSVGANTKPETSPLLTELASKNDIKNPVDAKVTLVNEGEINGNAGAAKNHANTADHASVTEHLISKEGAIIKANATVPFVELKSTDKTTTSQQFGVDGSSIAAVKNDHIDAEDQNSAQQSDYSEAKEFDNHVMNVKRPGMTENQEDVINQNLYRDVSTVPDDSYFFTYFMMLCVVFIFAYVGYHNKQKIIAIVVEGRRGNSGVGRGVRSRGGRRPNSANYHKLDSNLEEAVSSNTTTVNTSKVIY